MSAMRTTLLESPRAAARQIHFPINPRRAFVFAKKTLHFVLVGVLLMAASTAARAADLVKVRVGVTSSSSDAGFYIADKKGYFRKEGLEVQLIPFDSAAKMVAPLGAGQLEVGGGAPSAGFYNALSRGIEMKIVADKGSTPPGYDYQPLLVRKDLVDSGRYKSLKDLKGMKIAGSALGSGSNSALNEGLKQGGVKYSEVERVFMSFPQHVIALQNKAVDASVTTEPSATQAVQSGAAVRVLGTQTMYPYQQVAVVLYGGAFIKTQPEVAKRFMRAYVTALRDYNDALKDGKLAGPRGEEVISILTEYTRVKDAAIYRTITPQGSNPDGKVHQPSLKNDLQFFKDQNEVKGAITVEEAIDNTFVDAAIKDLGPYVPMAR
jgi:NitT/TauT family transport system substrate-binding protein